MAGEFDAIQARRVEPPGEPVAHLFGAHRMPQAWKIDDVDAPSSAQLLEHRGPPAPRSCEAVNEHERFAAAGCSVPDGATVDLDLVELYRHLIQSGRCGRRSCRSDWSEPTA